MIEISMPRGAFSGGILTVPRQTVYNIICRIKTSGQIEQRSRAQADRQTVFNFRHSILIKRITTSKRDFMRSHRAWRVVVVLLEVSGDN